MAYIEVKNVRIAGMSAGVPKFVCDNKRMAELLNQYVLQGGTTIDDFIASTGVKQRRADPGLTTSDLALPAAEQLIADLGWDKKSIGALIFVSQTADYILPATACILQDKLGLSRECYATDISLGCSGWVYGLSMVASLVGNGHGDSLRRALLIAGDSKGRVSSDDPLFGAAATVTAIEYEEGGEGFKFHFGTDGSGYEAIIVPDGGARNGVTKASFEKYEFDGKMFSPLAARMDGMEVFTFGFTTAPKSVKRLAERFGFEYQDCDYFVFHQANKMMNDKIAKKLKLDTGKVPMSIQDFGNTSSASIPLTIVSQLKGKIEDKDTRFVCCGFGVGLSWGTVAYTQRGCVISDLVEVGDETMTHDTLLQMYKSMKDEL